MAIEQKWNASVEALQATENVTIQVAPGVGKTLYVQKGTVDIILAATGGGGRAALENGVNGTRIVDVDASALGHFAFDFGDPGMPLSANTLFNVTVDGATTNEATAHVTVTGVIL